MPAAAADAWSATQASEHCSLMRMNMPPKPAAQRPNAGPTPSAPRERATLPAPPRWNGTAATWPPRFPTRCASSTCTASLSVTTGTEAACWSACLNSASMSACISPAAGGSLCGAVHLGATPLFTERRRWPRAVYSTALLRCRSASDLSDTAQRALPGQRGALLVYLFACAASMAAPINPAL